MGRFFDAYDKAIKGHDFFGPKLNLNLDGAESIKT